MQSDEAFRILELPPSASLAEIEARFRELARDQHPDVGGTDEAMALLNLARDTAVASASAGVALVPVEAVKAIIVASSQAITRRQELREEVTRSSARLRERATSRLRRMKDLAAVVGALSAAGLFLGKDLPAQYFESLHASEQTAGMVSLLALSVAIYAGLFFWMLTDRIRRIEMDVEDLRQFISSKSNYIDFLLEIDPDRSRWTFEELESAVEAWSKAKAKHHQAWRSLARVVSASDFVHLLLAKGRELEIIDTEEETNGRRLQEHYVLRIGAA